MRKVSLVLVGVLLLAAVAFAGKKPENKQEESEHKYSDLTFTVLKAETGVPVRNASVVLHAVNKKGRQESGGIQLKTDSEGRASSNSIPYGKLRVQVIAHGLQTFGDDYDINQPKHDFVIKLNNPKQQYSIYDK
jgi:5-hydroxyisourate hydrolase-like protein (transthyretin family)